MNAIRIFRHLTSHVIDLPELASMIGKDDEIIVLEEPQADAPQVGPKAGSAKGQISMTDNFDARVDDSIE